MNVVDYINNVVATPGNASHGFSINWAGYVDNVSVGGFLKHVKEAYYSVLDIIKEAPVCISVQKGKYNYDSIYVYFYYSNRGDFAKMLNTGNSYGSSDVKDICRRLLKLPVSWNYETEVKLKEISK